MTSLNEEKQAFIAFIRDLGALLSSVWALLWRAIVAGFIFGAFGSGLAIMYIAIAAQIGIPNTSVMFMVSGVIVACVIQLENQHDKS